MKKLNPNMSEKEQDKLFQEAARSFQPPDEKRKIWVLLERRIEDNARYQNRKIYRTIATILILIILMSMLIYSHNTKQSRTTKNNLTEEMLKRQKNMKYNKKTENNSFSSKKMEYINQKGNNYATKGFKNQLFIANKRLHTKEFKDNNKIPFVNNIRGIAFSPEIKNEIDDHSQIVLPPVIKYPHLFKRELAKPIKDSIDSLSFLKGTKSKQKKKVRRVSSFSLQLIAGPDWSTVKLEQWRKPAWDIGLIIGYRFANRWTVQTGIINGGKNYNSHSIDFDFPDNTPNRDDINEVTAEAHILTVPLNIIYSLSQNKHHSLSISMGLSSYWFLTEEYTYHYKSNTGLTDKHFELENMDKNIFSIINISPIYEYYLNKNISLMAAPYFQLPFSKIGYGHVSMQSAGIDVGAGYHF